MPGRRVSESFGRATPSISFNRRRSSAESISNIERGIQLPSVGRLADPVRELGIPPAEFLSDIPWQKRIPADRLRMEAQLREIARGLSNHDLATAIGLLEVLAPRAGQK